MDASGQLHAPVALPENTAPNILTPRWIELNASLNTVEKGKSLPLPQI
jgi:hypothetical protein